MPTHIDVLVGDYESCVRWSIAAIKADKKAMIAYPQTNNQFSFYFGYSVHDYDMLIYGCILGAMEKIAMEVAKELNSMLSEDFFKRNPAMTMYLESHVAMDIHILVRFGRWRDILLLKFPKDSELMLYRSASLYFARALAYANLGGIDQAKEEAKCYEKLRANPEAKNRILHNNTVSDLLNVDSAMMKGEIAYFAGNHEYAFEQLRRGIELQDGLNYDEPWGKMQPIRHALGGLMLKQGLVDEAEEVFRADLKIHPRNPWALTGLIGCLKQQLRVQGSVNDDSNTENVCCSSQQKQLAQKSKTKSLTGAQRDQKLAEMNELQIQLEKQRKSEWADYNVTHACACCCLD